ncbi:hypothetical protein AB0L44_17340 [Nonomuraea wenchangensis]|uniref:hypothetical protein n=1 Tax=Nonomuraea wenchangensis TaxID=568860 RepID=UPI00343E1110
MATSGEDRWLSALRDHAARLAFPDWTPQPGDWAYLYTGFDDDGVPYTEVAVYRCDPDGGHERIRHTRYRSGALTAFWARLVSEITE